MTTHQQHIAEGLCTVCGARWDGKRTYDRHMERPGNTARAAEREQRRAQRWAIHEHYCGVGAEEAHLYTCEELRETFGFIDPLVIRSGPGRDPVCYFGLAVSGPPLEELPVEDVLTQVWWPHVEAGCWQVVRHALTDALNPGRSTARCGEEGVLGEGLSPESATLVGMDHAARCSGRLYAVACTSCEAHEVTCGETGLVPCQCEDPQEWRAQVMP